LPESQKDCTKIMGSGAFVKHVFLFVTAGAPEKGGMGEERSICVVIDGRALKDFITFIYTPIFTV